MLNGISPSLSDEPLVPPTVPKADFGNRIGSTVRQSVVTITPGGVRFLPARARTPS